MGSALEGRSAGPEGPECLLTSVGLDLLPPEEPEHAGDRVRPWLATGLLTPPAVNPVWELRAAADFDLVNGTNLVYQNTSTNELYMWHMSGTSLMTSGPLSHPATGTWQIVGGR